MPGIVAFFQKNRRRIAGAASSGLLLVGLICAGVGGENEALTGTIAGKDGKPVTWGTVTAIGPDNRVYTAPIQPDGTYRLTGLPPGPVRITVASPNPTPSQVAGAAGLPGKAGAKPPAAKNDPKRAYGVSPILPPPETPVPQNVPAQWRPIDGKYANPNTSGLTATPGAGKHNITVE